MFEIALQWLVVQPEVEALALGPSNADQFMENITALRGRIDADLLREAELLISQSRIIWF